MESVTGFLLINLYAFLVIVATSIIFFSKKRMGEIEDELYKKFLLVNVAMSVFGLIFGMLVDPIITYNKVLVVLFNKLYMVTLFLWIFILTLYTIYISLKDKDDYPKVLNVFKIVEYFSLLLIILLPTEVKVTDTGAIASGIAVIFSYFMFAMGFMIQLGCLFVNHKNGKNKKYIPLYMLIIICLVILISMIVNPAINYIVNPALIFVAFVMYHTIENPDVQMNAYLLRNKEITEASVNEKSNFLFKISQEMKKPILDIMNNIKNYSDKYTKAEMKELIQKIESDANNAYFIINDISSVSSMDVKKLKIETNKYRTDKFFKDLEYNAKNKISLSGKNIDFKFNLINSCADYLYGDNIKLKQILLSIISNSIKYTDEGFIDVEVDSIIRYDVNRLIFTIKDSGCGMSLAKINDLLSKDIEIDIEKFDSNDDLELKMPIVIKMLKILGGSISMKSEEGKGTIVVVVFDQRIVDNDKKIIENAKHNNLTKTKKRRVLVIDDTDDIKIITKKLNDYGVDIISSVIGKECIDKINSGDVFDLIILKDELKDENAYTILKELKSIKKFNIPVIIKIEKDKEFIKDHFIEDGFSDCLVSESLDNELDKVLSKYL